MFKYKTLIFNQLFSFNESSFAPDKHRFYYKIISIASNKLKSISDNNSKFISDDNSKFISDDNSKSISDDNSKFILDDINKFIFYDNNLIYIFINFLYSFKYNDVIQSYYINSFIFILNIILFSRNHEVVIILL